MKKFSTYLFKVSLLLIIGLYIFGMTSKVEATPENIEKEVGESYTITVPTYTSTKQAIWDYWIIDDGKKEDKDCTKSEYITATLDKKSILVQQGDGGYYQKLNIKFNKAGSCTIKIKARMVDEDGTWDYGSQILPYNQYEYKITVKENTKATLTMDFNGGTKANGNKTESKAYTKNSEITIPNRSDITREGYNLIGWGTDKKTVKYKIGDKLKLTANTTIYAVWKKTAKPVLTLDYNGGTDGGKNKGTAWDGGSDNIYTIVGNEVTVVENNKTVNKTITRDGYEFVGWAKTANATKADYKKGDILTITQDTTIYTIWKKVGGGYNSNPQPSESLTKGDKIKYNYSSEGWNVRSGKSTKDDNVVGEIVKGNVVEVTETSGNWATVKYDGGTGYIYFNATAKGRFETVDSATAITGISVVKSEGNPPTQPPTQPSTQPGNFDFDTSGFMGQIVNFIIEFVIPNIIKLLNEVLIPTATTVIQNFLS